MKCRKYYKAQQKDMSSVIYMICPSLSCECQLHYWDTSYSCKPNKLFSGYMYIGSNHSVLYNTWNVVFLLQNVHLISCSLRAFAVLLTLSFSVVKVTLQSPMFICKSDSYQNPSHHDHHHHSHLLKF